MHELEKIKMATNNKVGIYRGKYCIIKRENYKLQNVRKKE